MGKELKLMEVKKGVSTGFYLTIKGMKEYVKSNGAEYTVKDLDTHYEVVFKYKKNERNFIIFKSAVKITDFIKDKLTGEALEDFRKNKAARACFLNGGYDFLRGGIENER